MRSTENSSTSTTGYRDFGQNFGLRPGRERHESLSVTHCCFSYALRCVVAMAMLVLIVAVQIAPVEELAVVIAMVC